MGPVAKVVLAKRQSKPTQNSKVLSLKSGGKVLRKDLKKVLKHKSPQKESDGSRSESCEAKRQSNPTQKTSLLVRTQEQDQGILTLSRIRVGL